MTFKIGGKMGGQTLVSCVTASWLTALLKFHEGSDRRENEVAKINVFFTMRGTYDC